jgi:hypothetical protein
MGKRAAFDHSDTVVAVTGGAVHVPKGPPAVVVENKRLRGDDPIVEAKPEWFVLADGTDAEVAARKAARLAELEPIPEPQAPPQPLAAPPRIEDLVVAIADVGGLSGQSYASPTFVPQGTRVTRDHPLARQCPTKFVAVVPPGVSPDTAVVALATVSSSDPYDPDNSDRNQVVHQGQLARRDHRFVALYPDSFAEVGAEAVAA